PNDVDFNYFLSLQRLIIPQTIKLENPNSIIQPKIACIMVLFSLIHKDNFPILLTEKAISYDFLPSAFL
ncbi:MAG TPA: hypothetical protein DDW42_09600, partial [Desulfobacteraceae bacterium]|nr:hypothetical protein [Desulfobacteraceae bacterium]